METVSKSDYLEKNISNMEFLFELMVREVTVERFSNSQNPIASEQKNGKDIMPVGAVAGKTVEVDLEERAGYFVGHIQNPTEDQIQRMCAWHHKERKKRKERAKTKRRKERKKEKMDSTQREKRDWKESNKNHLLNDLL